MTFEQWLKRPVYRVQCYTWALAHQMGVGCATFRCLLAYRDHKAKEARRKVAEVVRLMRSIGGAHHRLADLGMEID